MSRVVSRYIYSRKKPSTCSFHRAIFRGVFFFHVHKEGRIRVVFTRPSASRSLSALALRSYQPFCTRSLRNDACREIHGVTVSGSAKIAYCFTGQNVALFLSSISESNLFRFDTRYKLFAGFCTLNHSIYMLLYVAELDFFFSTTRVSCKCASCAAWLMIVILREVLWNTVDAEFLLFFAFLFRFVYLFIDECLLLMHWLFGYHIILWYNEIFIWICRVMKIFKNINSLINSSLKSKKLKIFKIRTF